MENNLSQRFLAVAGSAIELAKKKQNKQALLMLNKLDIDPEFEPDLYHLVQIQKAALLELLEREKPAKMLRNYDAALTIYRNIPNNNRMVYRSAQMQLANLLIQLQQLEEVNQLYQSYLTLELDAEDKLFLSSLLMSLNKVEDALAMLSKIKLEDGKHLYATAKTNQALLLNKLKRYEESILACMEIAQDYDSNMYAKSQLIWAEALFKLGRKEEAFVVYKRLTPHHGNYYSEARWQLLIRFPAKSLSQNITSFFTKR